MLSNHETLGDALFKTLSFRGSFQEANSRLETLKKEGFLALNEQQKTVEISQLLATLILEASTPCFLLPQVIDFIRMVLDKGMLSRYTLASFEIWLAQFSELSEEKNLEIRARIVGKSVPRDCYQLYFPISGGKSYAGSHYVTAHVSPDLDTTVASFWGFVDAFGAKVAKSCHIWNVPAGLPNDLVEIPLLFEAPFGKGLLEIVGKNKSSLSLSALDLMNQEGVMRLGAGANVLEIEPHADKSLLLLDESGYFLGNFQEKDLEGALALCSFFRSCLQRFEAVSTRALTQLFSKDTISKELIQKTLKELKEMTLSALVSKESRGKNSRYLDLLLKTVFGFEKGVETQFSQLPQSDQFFTLLEKIEKTEVARSSLFALLAELLEALNSWLANLDEKLLQLGACVEMKHQVFNQESKTVGYRSELEELLTQANHQNYLTVTHTDEKGRQVPLGVIQSSELKKKIQGSVTLRDFSNREETKIPSYFEVISVMDHHKFSLASSAPPVVSIADVQSANVLLAEMSFQINDRYSTIQMDEKSIKEQMAALQNKTLTLSQQRILQRLLQRSMNSHTGYFISKEREMIEYCHFLYAIFDDTDLLSKVTMRDVECISSLINRLESLRLQKEVEIITLDDLPRDADFANKAAARILTHPQTYSLYKKIYAAKEARVEEHLEALTIFADTKVQNGFASVGQTKLFATNFATYKKKAAQLQQRFIERSKASYAASSTLSLHLHMISTVASAEEVYTEKKASYTHKDELWLFIPDSEEAIMQLKTFLSGFSTFSKLKEGELEFEVPGDNGDLLAQIFRESFLDIPKVSTKAAQLPIAIARFKPGLLNSRKFAIMPYLPK